MKTKGLLMLIVAVCLALMLLAPACAAKPAPTPTPTEVFNWKFAQFTAPQDSQSKDSDWWASELEKRTDGLIKTRVYYSGELAGGKEILGTVESGIADVGQCAFCFYPGELPLSNITFLPFISPDRLDQLLLVWNEVVRTCPLIREEYAKHNAIYVWHHNTPGYNAMGRVAIRKADDFKGVRIRVIPVQGEVLKKFGAVPTMVIFGETYTALATGIVDMACTHTQSFYVYDWYEVSDYWIRDLELGHAGSGVLLNKDSWDALPDSAKAVIEDLKLEMAARAQWSYRTEMDQEAIAAFKKAGVEEIKFPAEERAKLMDVAPSVWQDWVTTQGEPGKEVLEAYLAAKDKILKEYPNGLPPYTPK